MVKGESFKFEYFLLAFRFFGHILIWLGKVTMQNPLYHLEYLIFCISYSMQIECI